MHHDYEVPFDIDNNGKLVTLKFRIMRCKTNVHDVVELEHQGEKTVWEGLYKDREHTSFLHEIDADQKRYALSVEVGAETAWTVEFDKFTYVTFGLKEKDGVLGALVKVVRRGDIKSLTLCHNGDTSIVNDKLTNHSVKETASWRRNYAKAKS